MKSNLFLIVLVLVLIGSISCFSNSLASSDSSSGNNSTKPSGSSSLSSSSDSNSNGTPPSGSSSLSSSSDSNGNGTAPSGSESSSSENSACTVYISVLSNTTSTACGSKQNPCSSLSNAISSCYTQGKNQSMTFNFDDGLYSIPNNLYIYNQTVMVFGSVNGNTIFQFANASQYGIIINESLSDSPSSADTTTFMISNVTVINLDNSFIKTSTIASDLTVGILRCSFKNVSIGTNFIQVSGANESLVNILVEYSNFTEFQYNGAIGHSPGFIYYARYATTTIINCIFTFNQGNASMIHMVRGNGFISSSSFLYNTVFSAVYCESQYTQFIEITGNTMSNNGPNGLSSALIYSFSSIVSVDNNIFDSNTDIQFFYVVDYSNVTNTTQSNVFGQNIAQNNTITTTNGYNFINSQNGSNIQINNNNFGANSLSQGSSGIYGYQSQYIYILGNTFSGNQGIFIDVSQCMNVQILENVYNGGNGLLNCSESSIITGNNNNVNIQSLINLGEVICGNKCNINKKGCSPTSDSSDSKPKNNNDNNNNNNSNRIKIIIAVVVTLGVGTLITVGIIYYVKVHKKRHAYHRINQ